MEHPSPVDRAPAPKQILESQLRDCFGRVVYSHKTHEKCADLLSVRLSRIKLAQIVLSAITTAGFVAVFFGLGDAGVRVGVVVSTVLLILNAYTKGHDLGELAQKHRQAASELWFVREKYLSAIADLRIGDVPIADLQERRDRLLAELHGVYAGAPGTTFKAYRTAQRALKTFEDLSFSDSEIDAFLPEELKKATAARA